MVKIKRYQRDLKTNDFSFERKYPYYIKNLIKLQLGYVDIIMSLAYFDFENILTIISGWGNCCIVLYCGSVLEFMVLMNSNEC